MTTGISVAAGLGMALTAAGVAALPGPNMLYLVSRAMSQGRRAALISLVGTVLGFGVYVALANIGLAVVFVAVPWLYVGVKAAGVVYLSYLAWRALRPSGHGLLGVRQVRPDTAAALLGKGLLTNLLNPKTAMLYLALIPQFIDPARGSFAGQAVALGVIQIVVAVCVLSSVVCAAGVLAGVIRRRPEWMSWQRRVTGTLLGAAAVVLARQVPRHASL